MKRILTFVAFCAAACAGNGDSSERSSYAKDCYVCDPQVALKMAELILNSVYGKDEIQRQKPFSIKDTGDSWIISGSLPKNSLGGVANIEIDKRTGTITNVTHGK
jgi:hypothetical protein